MDIYDFHASCKDSIVCEHPRAQLSDSQIVIMGNDDISIGIILKLSCPTGFVLTGPNTSESVCMGNGEWEPDPREAKCKGEKVHGIL